MLLSKFEMLYEHMSNVPKELFGKTSCRSCAFVLWTAWGSFKWCIVLASDSLFIFFNEVFQSDVGSIFDVFQAHLIKGSNAMVRCEWVRRELSLF